MMSERKKCKVLGVQFDLRSACWHVVSCLGHRRCCVQLWEANSLWFAEMHTIGGEVMVSGPVRKTKPAAYRALIGLLSDELKDRWPEVLRPPLEKARKRGGK